MPITLCRLIVSLVLLFTVALPESRAQTTDDGASIQAALNGLAQVGYQRHEGLQEIQRARLLHRELAVYSRPNFPVAIRALNTLGIFGSSAIDWLYTDAFAAEQIARPEFLRALTSLRVHTRSLKDALSYLITRPGQTALLIDPQYPRAVQALVREGVSNESSLEYLRLLGPYSQEVALHADFHQAMQNLRSVGLTPVEALAELTPQGTAGHRSARIQECMAAVVHPQFVEAVRNIGAAGYGVLTAASVLKTVEEVLARAHPQFLRAIENLRRIPDVYPSNTSVFFDATASREGVLASAQPELAQAVENLRRVQDIFPGSDWRGQPPTTGELIQVTTQTREAVLARAHPAFIPTVRRLQSQGVHDVAILLERTDTREELSVTNGNPGALVMFREWRDRLLGPSSPHSR